MDDLHKFPTPSSLFLLNINHSLVIILAANASTLQLKSGVRRDRLKMGKSAGVLRNDNKHLAASECTMASLFERKPSLMISLKYKEKRVSLLSTILSKTQENVHL